MTPPRSDRPGRALAALLAPLAFLALTACPSRGYGIHTGVERLSAVPDAKCVEDTIRAAPGVTSVRSHTRQDGRERFYYWMYYASPVDMDIRVEHNGRAVHFYHMHSRPSPIPEDERRAVGALMLDVEARLVAACGVRFERREKRKRRSG